MTEEEILDILDEIQHNIKYLEEEIIKIKEHLCIGYLNEEEDDIYGEI